MSINFFVVRFLPNAFTLSRLFISIIMIVLYAILGNRALDIIFPLYTLACISDFADGYFARKYNIISDFGRCFDIIADKILLLSTMMIVVLTASVHYIFAFIILFREFYVSGLREVISAKNIIIKASNLGKWKTGFQMAAGGFGICCNAPAMLKFFGSMPVMAFFATNVEIYTFLLFLSSSILTLVSAAIYTKQVF